MPHADLVIVRVVCGSYLDGSSTKLHVGDLVRDDRDAAVEERVKGKLAVEMLWPARQRLREKRRTGGTNSVSRILGVDRDPSVTEHGLGTSGGDDDLLVGSLDLVNEGGDDSELEPLGGEVAGDGEESAARQDLLVDLGEV